MSNCEKLNAETDRKYKALVILFDEKERFIQNKEIEFENKKEDIKRQLLKSAEVLKIKINSLKSF